MIVGKMKNNECEIQVIMRSTGWTQSYRKHNGGWVQTTNGTERYLSAEQLLSHILPILVEGYKGDKRIRVIPDNIKKNI